VTDPQPVTRLWDDLGYHVTAKPIWPNGDSHNAVDVSVVRVEDNGGTDDPPRFEGPDGRFAEDIERAVPVLTGEIKWDGCAHLYPREYVHICSKDDARRWGEMLQRLYDLAAEMMPGWREYLT
jgi:hypothetical protein